MVKRIPLQESPCLLEDLARHLECAIELRSEQEYETESRSFSTCTKQSQCAGVKGK